MTSQECTETTANHLNMIREELVSLQTQYQISALNVSELANDMTSFTYEFDILKDQVSRLKEAKSVTSLKFETTVYKSSH